MATGSKSLQAGEASDQDDGPNDAVSNDPNASMKVNVSTGNDSWVSSHKTTREIGEREDHRNAVAVSARVAKACLDAHQALRPSCPKPEEHDALVKAGKYKNLKYYLSNRV